MVLPANSYTLHDASAAQQMSGEVLLGVLLLLHIVRSQSTEA